MFISANETTTLNEVLDGAFPRNATFDEGQLTFASTLLDEWNTAEQIPSEVYILKPSENALLHTHKNVIHNDINGFVK